MPIRRFGSSAPPPWPPPWADAAGENGPRAAAAAVPAAAPTKPRRLSLGSSPMLPSFSHRAHTPAARVERPTVQLIPLGGLREQPLDCLVERHGALVALAMATQRDGPLLGLAVPDHEHVRDLLQLGLADLAADRLGAVVDLGPQ